MLLSAALLDFSYVLDIPSIPYTLYDELSALRKTSEVERHLLYVKEHQGAYSKQNKPKYLRFDITRLFK